MTWALVGQMLVFGGLVSGLVWALWKIIIKFKNHPGRNQKIKPERDYMVNRYGEKFPTDPIERELEKIQKNIHPVQWSMYEQEIRFSVAEGWKLHSANNNSIYFLKPKLGTGNDEFMNMKAPVKAIQSKKFEARTHCGECGTLDVHSMREPKVKSSHCDGTELPYFVLDTYRIDQRYEWEWSVIRICNNCGHEWGQE